MFVGDKMKINIIIEHSKKALKRSYDEEIFLKCL